MTNSKLLKLSAVVPLALMLSAQTTPPQSDTYTLSMIILDDGELIGEPVLRVAAGEVAMVHIEPGDGSSYLATFTITPMSDDLLSVTSDWNATSDTLGTVAFKPTLIVEPNEAARIVYGSEGPGISPLDVSFSVSPHED